MVEPRTEPERDAGEKSANGPPVSASSWVEEHGDALFRYALGRLGRREAAEDMVQETFLAALAAAARFRGGSSTRTWLVAILRRKIADSLRGDASAPRKAVAFDPVALASFERDGTWSRPPSRWKEPGGAVETEELRDALDGCCGKLPPMLAEAFLLRERDGLEAEEIRLALGLSPANLRVRLHRARLLLRECLERNWFRDP